jgi:hypothetical protein
MTESHNGSSYSISIINAPALARSSVDALTLNARSAIHYLADHVRWKGSLDFVIKWDTDNQLGSYWYNGGPGFAAYGGITGSGKTHAQAEALSGGDTNGADYEVGMWVNPTNITISDYGRGLFIDPDPNPRDDDLFSGERDFLSTFLHESLHGLGYWSTAQHGDGSETEFDSLTTRIGGQWFFTGPKTQEVYGGALPLAITGSRDHYSDSLPYEIDMMREFGHAEKWQLSNIDLAILQDLGYEIIQWIPDKSEIPSDSNVETPATPATPTPTQESPVLGIQPQETITTVELTTPLTLGTLQVTQAVVGTPQRDVITGSDEGEALAGGKGKDQITGGGGPDAFVFETAGEFGKKSADVITDFNSDQGDKVAVASEAFEGVSKIKFKSATGKKQSKNLASSNKTFIYDDKKGVLYFNENGREDGFGDGGEFVKLLGAPDLSKSDIVIV